MCDAHQMQQPDLPQQACMQRLPACALVVSAGWKSGRVRGAVQRLVCFLYAWQMCACGRHCWLRFLQSALCEGQSAAFCKTTNSRQSKDAEARWFCVGVSPLKANAVVICWSTALAGDNDSRVVGCCVVHYVTTGNIRTACVSCMVRPQLPLFLGSCWPDWSAAACLTRKNMPSPYTGCITA